MFCVTLQISARKYIWESRFSAKRFFATRRTPHEAWILKACFQPLKDPINIFAILHKSNGVQKDKRLQGSLLTIVVRTQLSMIAGQTFHLHQHKSAVDNRKVPESVQEMFLTRLGQTVILKTVLPSVVKSVQVSQLGLFLVPNLNLKHF